MVRKFVRGMVMLLLGVLLLAIGGYAYIETTYDRDYSSIPLPRIQASTDPAVIREGEYLVHAVAHCSACHGPSESVKDHKLGDRRDLSGGFVLEAGPFGRFVPANLTPDPETGIGALNDGQIARAIRHGVDRNGKFAAFMALAVGHMSDEDLTAVISYLRSLPPARNKTAPDEWGLMAKALSGVFTPKNEPPMKHVASGTVSIERGEYLANGPAFCVGCHTAADPMEGFKPTGPKFSGEPHAEPDPTDAAFEFVAPNLTPDPETGIMASWTEDVFVARMRTGRVHVGSKMPWDNFAQMTDQDLRSIYRYLRTLPPTKKETGPSRRKAGSTTTPKA